MTGQYTQYPFPVSGGVAYLHIPGDVTREDAERFARFVASLVVPHEPDELEHR